MPELYRYSSNSISVQAILIQKSTVTGAFHKAVAGGDSVTAFFIYSKNSIPSHDHVTVFSDLFNDNYCHGL
jgi:hypothetical protein